MKKIAIIGGGNLGSSIAEGLAKEEEIDAASITVTRRKLEKIEHLKNMGIRITSDNRDAVRNAEVIITAVKPYNIESIIGEFKDELIPDRHILISVVTGVSLEKLASFIGKPIPVFRAMPNTAIAIQESMTCISGDLTLKTEAELVEGIFDRLGKTVFIEEALMDAATVLGACGIAYALRFIRAASQGGIEIGFSADEAQTIAAQTVKGAAALLTKGGSHPEREIDKVTTPMGCTIAGLNEMEHQGFSSALIKGVITSYNKIN